MAKESAPETKPAQPTTDSGMVNIRIGRPNDAGTNGVTVIFNAEKVFIPFDVDTPVKAGVYDILLHAIEPYPVKIKGENGVTKTGVKMRPRWTIVVVK